MGKIKASLADVSTDFKIVQPGLHVFEVAKVDEITNSGKYSNLESDDVIGYKINSKVVSSDDEEQVDRVIVDYVYTAQKVSKDDPTTATDNEIGLQTLKRYFESCFGKDEVAGWTDDDFDTDRLIGQQFRAQTKIEVYNDRQSARYSRMDSL